MPSDAALRSIRRWQALQTAFVAVLVALVAKHPDVYLTVPEDWVSALFVDLAPWAALGCLGYAGVLTLGGVALDAGAADDGGDA